MSTAYSPIEVFVSASTITVADDLPASFMVAIEISEGTHIVAALPGDSDAAQELFPLRVGLTQGQGIAVYADYPEGHPHTLDELGTFNTNTGRIEFEIAIEKAPGIGVAPGAPVIGISFQSCDDSTCQGPRTVELKMEIIIN